MSLATLKRKSNTLSSPSCGNSSLGFSLNGGFRNQGWVGQTNAGRVTHNRPNTNNPAIVKVSNMNTHGLINATVNHPTGVYNSSCENKCAPTIVPNLPAFVYTAEQQVLRKKLVQQNTIASCSTPACSNPFYKANAGTKSCNPAACPNPSISYAKNLNWRVIPSSQYIQNKNVYITTKMQVPNKDA